MKLYCHSTNGLAIEVIKIRPGSVAKMKRRGNQYTFLDYRPASLMTANGVIYSNEIISIELYDPLTKKSLIVKNGFATDFLKALSILMAESVK